MGDPIELECSHCGDIAFASSDPIHDGLGDACAACGFPGRVVLDAEPHDDDGMADAYWSCSDVADDMCKRPLCEECNGARFDLGLISRTRAKAVIAVNAIVDDLTDRRGLKSEWAGIERDIMWGICAAWIDGVEKAFEPTDTSSGGRDGA